MDGVTEAAKTTRQKYVYLLNLVFACVVASLLRAKSNSPIKTARVPINGRCFEAENNKTISMYIYNLVFACVVASLLRAKSSSPIKTARFPTNGRCREAAKTTRQ